MNETNNPQIDEKELLWNSAGMHRPIASFWYNYIFIIIAAIPGLLILGWFIPNILMPDPTSFGIATVVTTFFQLFFIMFDVGTGMAIERFIAEHAFRDPKRAVEYMQFFSWFQLFTGLIQTTIIAFYSLYITRYSDNAFLVWPFLIYSMTQYPGMLGVYKSALTAFQQHNKQIIVELLQNVLVQSATQVIFIIIFRIYGSNHPEIGATMGAAIGYIIGSYIDDFIGMILGAKFFSNVLKGTGLTLIDTLTPKFNKEIIKEVLIFGLKVLPAYAIEAFVSFLRLIMTINWIPNYTHIVAIVTIANSVASITSLSFTITPAISESYNNGYFNLTQYYIKQQWKHWSLIAMFLFVVVSIIAPPVFKILAGDYALAGEILILLLALRLIVFPINFGSAVSQGINKPEYHTYALFCEQTARAISFFILLNPWWGLINIIGYKYYLFLYAFSDFPAWCVKLVTQWYFVKLKLKFSVSPPIYQTFIAPLLTSIPLAIATWIPTSIAQCFVIKSILEGSDLIFGGFIFALVLLGAFFLFPIFIVFPIYGLVGGWDDDGLEFFIKASKISGPSSIFVKLMAKFSKWGHEISPLKNKFPIDYSKAKVEAEILTQKRIETYLKEKNSSKN